MACIAVACGTTPAPDFRGKWRPVNQASDVPQAIALQPRASSDATPADRTLRTVLKRWAETAGLTLEYAASHDYTLHAEAARVRTDDLYTALAEMERAYAAQGLGFAVEDGALRVRPGADAPASSPATAGR